MHDNRLTKEAKALAALRGKIIDAARRWYRYGGEDDLRDAVKEYEALHREISA